MYHICLLRSLLNRNRHKCIHAHTKHSGRFESKVSHRTPLQFSTEFGGKPETYSDVDPPFLPIPWSGEGDSNHLNGSVSNHLGQLLRQTQLPHSNLA